MTFFLRETPAVNPRRRWCRRKRVLRSNKTSNIAVSRALEGGSCRGYPAAWGSRGLARGRGKEREKKRERERERAAYIALGSSRLHRINGDDITLLHTHVDARVRTYSSLYNTDRARAMMYGTRTHYVAELPFNGISLYRRRNTGLKRLHSRKTK